MTNAPTLKPVVGPRRAWALLAHTESAVTVNGEPVHTGIRTLRDRDAIQVDDLGIVFFSTERLARVSPCPKTERATYCQRCKTKIEAGSLAVECPSCDAWHHQTDALPCWLYAETCALCSQPTDFDSDFRWRPEDL